MALILKQYLYNIQLRLMKLLKSILFLTFMLFIMATFSQCGVTKKLETNAPLTLGDVYYQQWIAGVQGGGSGINIFTPIISNPNNIMLDSVYFQGKQAKLEFRNNNVFIGRFKSDINKKKDIVMSSDPYAEYGNKVPEIPKKPAFKLLEDECVVSYKIANKVKYFKIENINKKDVLKFMSAPPKKQ